MSGSKKNQFYSDAFKRAVVQRALSGEMSKTELSRLYGIKGHSTISKWIRKLQSEPSNAFLKKGKTTPDSLSAHKRIAELEEALRAEQLRSEAYKKMIELAEEKFQISIEKKFDSKRSKK